MTTDAEITAMTLDEQARRYLWAHSGGATGTAEGQRLIIDRGEGCWVWDVQGERYLDGLSSLFCTNLGHGRHDLLEAGMAQARRLGYFNTWGFAHQPAIELATRIAGLAPADLESVFFTSGGSEAVESAIKLAREYHRVTGRPGKTKVIARELAFHGTTLGALSLTGIPALRQPFEPLMPGASHVMPTDPRRLAPGEDPGAFADSIEQRIKFEGPDSVGAVILEPVQNVGGCLTPPPGYFARVREICDEHDVLLIVDEAICAWGRLGEWFGVQRYGCEPDIIVTAKGITSGYAPLGAMIASRQLRAIGFDEPHNSFLHGFTFGGHPLATAIGLANIDAIEREGVLDHVRDHEGELEGMLRNLRDLPVVGAVRGAGYLWAVDILRDRDSNTPFADTEKAAVAGFLNDELLRLGLICRVDDRGPLAIHVAPPLIAGPVEFDEMEARLRGAFQALLRTR